jgi:hypothetical protein
MPYASTKGRQNKAITMNKEVGQTYTRKEEKLAGIPIEEVVRKCSQTTLILSTGRKT